MATLIQTISKANYFSDMQVIDERLNKLASELKQLELRIKFIEIALTKLDINANVNKSKEIK